MEFFLLRNGKLERFDLGAMQEKLRKREVDPDEMAWATGLDGWKRLKEILSSLPGGLGDLLP